jgi:Peptidase M50B-like
MDDFVRMTECHALPDACTNELHEERVIQRQGGTKGDRDTVADGRSHIQRVVERDRNLIIACVVLVVLMNFETGRYILYPFKIFSTWVHELCHGLAALLTPGGVIGSIRVYKDGGGVCSTSVKSQWASTFVSSAGYPGTAVTGFLMLIFRRTNTGPTIGLICLGVAMLLSVALYVRNGFAMWFLGLEGALLLLFAWKLPAHFIDNLYNFLAATCCLNAVQNVRDLFADYYTVGGEETTSTDAHSTADGWGGDYRMWAWIWLILSLVLTVLGVLFSVDARQLPQWTKNCGGGGGGRVGSDTVSYYAGDRTAASNYKAFGTPARVV